MQEKTKPLFVRRRHANDVSQLPPETLRKGRFDELFYVDLPDDTERESIWRIVIGKHRRDPNDTDLRQLSRITEALTGAEIGAIYLEAMFAAFRRAKVTTDLDIASVLNGFVLLSRLMAEQIEGLRKWSCGRARPATSTLPTSERRLRKLEV